MINLTGNPLHFVKPTIGVITRKPTKRWSRRNRVFICPNPDQLSAGYAAVLLSDENTSVKSRHLTRMAVIADVQGLDRLSDGDVVSLSPHGTISVLHQKQSTHNAIFVTNSCNCKCIMCPQSYEENVETESRLGVNLRLIELIDKSANTLAITGGEPTVPRQELLHLISACKTSLPDTALVLLTNGILLRDRSYVDQIVSIAHPNITYAIALYSDTDTHHDTIIGKKGFYDTLRGIYNLALYDQRIEIRTVLHAMNYHRIPRLAEFIYRNFPFTIHVAFMGLETTGLAMKNIQRLWIDPFDYVPELERAVTTLHRADINTSIYNHQLCTLPVHLWHFCRKSISSWKNVYLDECRSCELKEDCGGFFESSLSAHSNHIRPIQRPRKKSLTFAAEPSKKSL